MSNPARVGKNDWKAALKRAREANDAQRDLLRRIYRESSSPLVQALAGQIMLSLGDSDQSLNRLDEIGRNTEKRRPAE